MQNSERDPRLSVPLRGIVHGLTLGLLATVVGFVTMLSVFRRAPPPGGGWLVLLLPLLAGAVVSAIYWPASMVVGRDGVWLGRWWSKRFIPVREIASAEAYERTLELGNRPGSAVQHERGVTLRMKDGAAERLPMIGSEKRISEVSARISDIVRASIGGGSLAASLMREGRPLDDWKASLAELAKPGGFRDARLSSSDFEQILGDAAGSAEQRLGAAIALRATKSPEAESRIRVAAEASANPRVRIALERISNGEDADESIEAALQAETEATLGESEKP